MRPGAATFTLPAYAPPAYEPPATILWRSTTMKAPALLTVAISLGLLPALRAESPSAADVDFFEKQVRPLLVEHCFKCHGNGKTKGGLTLATRAGILKGGASGPAVVPGDAAKSLLIQA